MRVCTEPRYQNRRATVGENVVVKSGGRLFAGTVEAITDAGEPLISNSAGYYCGPLSFYPATGSDSYEATPTPGAAPGSPEAFGMPERSWAWRLVT